MVLDVAGLGAHLVHPVADPLVGRFVVLNIVGRGRHAVGGLAILNRWVERQFGSRPAAPCCLGGSTAGSGAKQPLQPTAHG